MPAIDWNTPIQRLLPDFRLAYPDPADNARLTLGDLYAHRSGLPATITGQNVGFRCARGL